jgi:hypothetical protein
MKFRNKFMTFSNKPIVVEASQFILGIRPWPNGVEAFSETGDLDAFRYCLKRYDEFGNVQRVYIDPGDWIIKASENEYPYPCKPDIFEATYEKVE